MTDRSLHIHRQQGSPQRSSLLTATGIALLLVTPTGFLIKNNPTVRHYEMNMLTSLQSAPAAPHTASSLLAQAFSPMVMVPVIAMLIIYVSWRSKDLSETLKTIMTAAAPISIVFIVKLLVNRARPSTTLGSQTADPSFPSGHVACAVAVSALFLLAMRAANSDLPQTPNTALHITEAAGNKTASWMNTVIITILVLIPIVVAISRLILGVHYPSDVLTSLILCPLLSASAYRINWVSERTIASVFRSLHSNP